MKSIYRILAVLFVATVILAACTKESSDLRLDPKLETTQVLSVKSDSAKVIGFIIAAGDGFIEKGVCYKTSANPTVADNKVAYTGKATTAAFTVDLFGLAYATKYYVRAYATSESGTIYGEEFSFTTLPVVPTLTTAALTNVTGNSATGGGEVTNAGGATVTARGVCFGTSPNPTIANQKTVDGNGLGAFTSALTGMQGNKMYYVRAYATNSAGTGYGPQVTVTTSVDLPTVTTTAISNITKTSASSGGNVTYDGGGTITERGIVWGTSANPTTANNVIITGSGTGAFTTPISGLSVFTTYHVRAYAKNSAGTAYGNNIEFKTLADITKLFVVGDYNSWNNSPTAKFIISTPSNSTAEGYVYLTTGGIKLTTNHSWDDNNTFGDNGSGGLTNPGGNIPVTTAGYYRIRANLGTMTYSLTLTTWGIIGDATPGGWGAQTNMTYNPTTQKHYLVANLTSGGAFKFRGTSDWAVNYGSSDGSTLVHDGANIAIGTTADYDITLDLSTPNEYKYSANRWGLIGDATPGGWGTDTDMTWDGANQVFTVTLNLVVGNFKFRANDGWDVNLGGALTSLTAGGADIPVAEAGNYTITLNTRTNVATVTKNARKK
jgi:starch-binding outer membrane protein SusE/F